METNWVDITIIAVIGISAIVSLFRGLAREVLSLGGWAAAFWVAVTFSSQMSRLLEGVVESPAGRSVIAFGTLFIAALILVALLNFMIGQLIAKTGLTGTDRVLGMVFGMARGAVVVAALVFVAGFTSIPNDPWWTESHLLHYFQELATFIGKALPDDFASNLNFNPKEIAPKP